MLELALRVLSPDNLDPRLVEEVDIFVKVVLVAMRRGYHEVVSLGHARCSLLLVFASKRRLPVVHHLEYKGYSCSANF